MAMPTNAELKTQIEAISKEIAEMRAEITDLKGRMKTQEETAQANHQLLQSIYRQMQVVKLAFSGSGRWLGSLATTAIGGGIIALIYHFLASWH